MENRFLHTYSYSTYVRLNITIFREQFAPRLLAKLKENERRKKFAKKYTRDIVFVAQ